MAGFADLYKKMTGVVDQIMQFRSGDGALLKEDGAGILQSRDSGDAAFAKFQAADPTVDDDLVTLRYHNANPSAGGVTQVRFALALVTASSVTLIPATAQVVKSQVEITTPYSAGGTIDIGDGTTVDLIHDQTEIKETKAGAYQVEQDTAWPLGTAVTATVGGAPAAGAAIVSVWYVIPNV